MRKQDKPRMYWFHGQRACVTFGLIIKLSRFVGTRECTDKIIMQWGSLRTHRRGVSLRNFPLESVRIYAHLTEVRTCDMEISSMGWQYWPFDPSPCKLAHGYQHLLLSRLARPRNCAENFIILLSYYNAASSWYLSHLNARNDKNSTMNDHEERENSSRFRGATFESENNSPRNIFCYIYNVVHMLEVSRGIGDFLDLYYTYVA